RDDVDEAGGVAADERTQLRLRSDCVVAAVNYLLSVQGGDGTVDTDVVVVDRETEPRQERRRQHHADTDRVGLFRLQVRIASYPRDERPDRVSNGIEDIAGAGLAGVVQITQ